MIIANPIYDTVFKHLMSDADDNIAKRFIEQILNIEILEFNFDNTEFSQVLEERKKSDIPLSIYRLDFIAKIKTEQGPVTVLIELQKSWEEKDVYRFRNYLAEEYKRHFGAYINYMDELEVIRKERLRCKKENRSIPDLPEKNIPQALPIIAIYILDKELFHDRMMIHVDPVYKDPNKNNEILKGKDSFIEQLIHNSYFIQIPRIPNKPKTHLENLLSIFNQTYLVENDSKRIDYHAELDGVKEPLLRDMLYKLQGIGVDAKIAKEIEARESGRKFLAERDILLWYDLELAEQKIRKTKEALENKDKVIENNQKELQNNQKVIENKDKEIENKDKEIEKMRDMINKLQNNNKGGSL